MCLIQLTLTAFHSAAERTLESRSFRRNVTLLDIHIFFGRHILSELFKLDFHPQR